MSTLGERLKLALSNKNMKQSVLAYRANIDRSYITNYIAGKYEPKPPTLNKMAEILGVSAAWLAGYDVSMYPDLKSAHDETSRSAIKIPVLGKVAAGIPIEAITEILDYEEIDAAMMRDGSEYFALQIKGDSMEPRMKDGDVVIVRRQSTIDSGQIAIVCINGNDATCKRVRLEPSGLVLIPFNSAYEPMYFSAQDIENIPITILGRVVELRAKFN